MYGLPFYSLFVSGICSEKMAIFPLLVKQLGLCLFAFAFLFPCATYKLALFLIVLYIIEEIYFTPGSYTESSNTCLVVISLSFLIVQLEVMCEVLKMVL